MQTVYIRFELDTDFVGTLNVIYRQYNFPDGWTTEEIENYIWDEYHDLQMEHYESYSDYYEYFEPQSSYKKCIKQKENLLNMNKYNKNNTFIFEDSKDGFRIDKIKIDFISHINYK